MCNSDDDFELPKLGYTPISSSNPSVKSTFRPPIKSKQKSSKSKQDSPTSEQDSSKKKDKKLGRYFQIPENKFLVKKVDSALLSNSKTPMLSTASKIPKPPKMLKLSKTPQIPKLSRTLQMPKLSKPTQMPKLSKLSKPPQISELSKTAPQGPTQASSTPSASIQTSHIPGKSMHMETLEEPPRLTPMRPLHPYLLYATEERSKVVAEMGNMAAGEVGKEMKRRWDMLNMCIKKKYEETYKENMVMYQKEMNRYKKSQGGILKKVTVKTSQNQQAMKNVNRSVEKEQLQQNPVIDNFSNSRNYSNLFSGHDTPSDIDDSDIDPNYIGTDTQSESSSEYEDDHDYDSDVVKDTKAQEVTTPSSDRGIASAPETQTGPKEKQTMKCKKCERKFVSLTSHHKHEVKCAKMIYKCNVCQQTMKNLRYLKVHVKNIHRKSNYKCDHPGCEEIFRTAFKLKVHKRKHLEGYNKCDICDKTFKNRSTMKVHKLKVHKLNKVKENKTWSCKLCYKKFKSDRGLRYHIELHESLKEVVEENASTGHESVVVGRGLEEIQAVGFQASGVPAGGIVQTFTFQAAVAMGDMVHAGGVHAGQIVVGDGQHSELVVAGGSEGEADRSGDLCVIENCPVEVDQVVFMDNIINI